MKPVAPEELSALLDDELDDTRALEVRAQLAADSRLRAEFEHLSRLHTRWQADAAAAAFAPGVHLPVETWLTEPAGVIVGAVILLVFRVVPKWLGSLAVGFGLHAAALLVVCWAVLWLTRAAPPAGSWQPQPRG